jgi:signal transduction histidine kinase
MQQSARIMPMRRDGRVDGVLVLVQDVTERVGREQELRDALEQAQAASQAKSEFLASMSHELRTPLSAIVGLHGAARGRDGRPRVAAAEELLRPREDRRAAPHQHHRGDPHLLRVEAGKEEIHVELVDVAVLARDVQDLFEPQALSKGVALTVSVHAERVVLGTDATKLRQILINLLGNAMKFTDAGRVALEITAGDDRVLFRIRDTGPGIPPSDLDRIFDPFTQVDQSLTRTKGGTGLGLPVSLRLAHLLGGDLTVESVAERGTTFTLWLPLKAGAPGDAAGTAAVGTLPRP